MTARAGRYSGDRVTHSPGVSTDTDIETTVTSMEEAAADNSVEHWRNKCRELEKVVKTLSSHCFKGKLLTRLSLF